MSVRGQRIAAAGLIAVSSAMVTGLLRQVGAIGIPVVYWNRFSLSHEQVVTLQS